MGPSIASSFSEVLISPLVELLEWVAMEWLSETTASAWVADGGLNSGDGVSRLEVCGYRSDTTTSDSDLRWVPPGSREAVLLKLGHEWVMIHPNVATEGTINGQGFFSFIPLSCLNLQSHFSNKGRRNCRNKSVEMTQPSVVATSALDPLSVDPEKKFNDRDPVFLVMLLQGTSEKKRLNSRDPEVSNFPNTHKASHRLDWDLSDQKGNRAEIVGSYIWLSVAYYLEVLKSEAASCSSHFSETRFNYGWIKAYVRLRNSNLVVTGLADLVWIEVWIVYRPKRKGLEAIRVKFMAVESAFLECFVWAEVLFSCLMAGVIVGGFAKARLLAVNVRIIILGLFSGLVHVHYGLDICLVSVNVDTAFIRAIYGPVQCVSEHCSLLGWSGDYTCYYLHGCAGLSIVRMLALLEFLPSRNLKRNHLYVWIPMEAYLAAGWFVKASVDCSYSVIRVYRAPSLFKVFWLVVVRILSCCIAGLLCLFVPLFMFVLGLFVSFGCLLLWCLCKDCSLALI